MLTIFSQEKDWEIERENDVSYETPIIKQAHTKNRVKFKNTIKPMDALKIYSIKNHRLIDERSSVITIQEVFAARV
ncbi:hypothetical protein [Legionella bononiensis]|uniref:Uncharacterized protein n=1 Tax=Legionella bononiensis TaxID=2793102 RepID=A0ABS1WF84_9GAMM|nr:hypothetical protein [Legionella bononiensis]MBL7479256.1 hypothetical protein [Legionella bononiensis]MBL7528016.1 hypothetical protein [Legionella bononiensis]MBL7563907.1 hypothetical protein [Legionella bononiensis]